MNSKLDMEYCVIWLIDLDTKIIGAEESGELRNFVLMENGEDTNWSEKDLGRVGKRTTLRRKTNWFGHILNLYYSKDRVISYTTWSVL